MKKTLLVMLTGLYIVLMSTIAFAGTWKQDAKGWWWDNGNGTYPSNCWQWCDGNNDGVSECYYFGPDGYCLRNTTTPDGYKVDANGAWIVNGVVQTRGNSSTGNAHPDNGWYDDGCGWLYYKNGKPVKNKILDFSNGDSYCFDEEGYMYYDEWVNDTYYVDEDGKMLKDTITPDGYYVDGNGKREGSYLAESAYYNYLMSKYWLNNNQYHVYYTRCWNCNGKGLEECTSCHCTGISSWGGTCSWCSGVGYKKCQYCDGTGQIKHTDLLR